MRGKKAQTAMGTLIIFIALVLTASIAASVMIVTMSTIQNRAVEVGQSTIAEIGTQLSVIEVFGTKNPSTPTIQNITLTTRLAAGSASIRLSDLLITIAQPTGQAEYTFSSNTTFSTSQFGAEHITSGAQPIEGHINRGDIVRISIQLPTELQEGERFRLTILPRTGTSTVVTGIAPSFIHQNHIRIFP
ncbi:MAG: hypothetical protein ACMXYE_04875 [Candidatus Woesearchaeota archaeon]